MRWAYLSRVPTSVSVNLAMTSAKSTMDFSPSLQYDMTLGSTDVMVAEVTLLLFAAPAHRRQRFQCISSEEIHVMCRPFTGA